MTLFGVYYLGNRAKSVQECLLILISLVAPYAPKVPTLRKKISENTCLYRLGTIESADLSISRRRGILMTSQKVKPIQNCIIYQLLMLKKQISSSSELLSNNSLFGGQL